MMPDFFFNSEKKVLKNKKTMNIPNPSRKLRKWLFVFVEKRPFPFPAFSSPFPSGLDPGHALLLKSRSRQRQIFWILSLKCKELSKLNPFLWFIIRPVHAVAKVKFWLNVAYQALVMVNLLLNAWLPPLVIQGTLQSPFRIMHGRILIKTND